MGVADTMSRNRLQPLAQQSAERQSLTVWLLRLYPRAWRDRYGAELAELLFQEPVSALAILHVVGGAVDAHLHPRLVTPGSRPSAQYRLRATVITVFCAYTAFLVAALAFFEAVHDLSLASLMRDYPQLTVPWTVLAAAAVVALSAVLAGGLPILITVLKEARMTRRGDLRLFAVPPLAVLVLCACDAFEELLRREHIALPYAVGVTLDVVFHVLFVLAAVLCTAAVCIPVVRSTIAVRLLRFALAPAAIVALAMSTMLGATVVWLAQARMDAPQRFGPYPVELGFALLILLMVVATLLAIVAVVRGLAVQTAAGPGTSMTV